MKLKLITETTTELVTESKDKDLYVMGIFSSYGVKNNNGRIYEERILKREVDKIMKKVNEKSCYGELNHPERPNVDLERAAILVEELKWRENNLYGKAKVLSKTPMGNIIKGIIDGGGKFGISSRGLGTVSENGYVNEDFQLMCWDIVGDPSNPASQFVNGIYEGRDFEIPGIEKKDIIEEKITLNEAIKEHEKRIWNVISEIKKSL